MDLARVGALGARGSDTKRSGAGERREARRERRRRDGDRVRGCSARAPAQHFHADGRARGIANAFVPLVDVPENMGPTRFRKGSHVDHDDLHPDRRARRGAEAAEEVAPGRSRGEACCCTTTG